MRSFLVLRPRSTARRLLVLSLFSIVLLSLAQQTRTNASKRDENEAPTTKRLAEQEVRASSMKMADSVRSSSGSTTTKPSQGKQTNESNDKKKKKIKKNQEQKNGTSTSERLSSVVQLVGSLWDDSAITVRESLIALGDLGSDQDAQAAVYRKDVAGVGGPISIIKTMEKFKDNADILAEGCRALWTLALGNNQANSDLIRTVRGMKQIVTAMQRFPDHVHLQVQGCGALQSLAYKNTDNARRIIESDGIAAVVHAMNTHPDHGKLQEHACQALWNIATVSQELKVFIVRSGALSAVGHALETHYSNPAVLTQQSARLIQMLAEAVGHF